MNGRNEGTPVQFTIRKAFAAIILFSAASLLAAFPASANQDAGGHKSKMGMKMGMKMDMKAASCGRNIMMVKSAEMQMGAPITRGRWPRRAA